MRMSWLWLAIIVLSAIGVGLVTFVMPVTPVRPLVVMWFLFICPGMALVRLFRLNEPVVKWTLALTLSFVIDAAVASVQLYAGRWSPTATLVVVISLSLSLALVPFIPVQYVRFIQYVQRATVQHVRRIPVYSAGVAMRSMQLIQRTTLQYKQYVVTVVPKRFHTLFLRATTDIAKPLRSYTVILQRRDVLKTVSLLLLVGISLGSIGFSSVYQNAHPARSAPVQAAKTTAHFSATSTKAPTLTPLPTPIPSFNVVGSYNGILHDIPTDMTTTISLLHIQQQQGHISGYFDTRARNNLFNGVAQHSPFIGTINHDTIHFTIASNAGQATFSFEGLMQSDGTLAGTYCGPGGTTQKCSDYGLWSISPGP